MSNILVTILVASAILTSHIAAAAPAKLTQVQGDVMVNNGSRFVKAVSGSELKPGAKIVTAKSSNVSVIYQNGCVKQLKQNTMHTVGTAEQCAANEVKERIYVAALGDVPLGKASTISPAITTISPAVIGFAATLGVVVATTSNDGNNNRNISAE